MKKYVGVRLSDGPLVSVVDRDTKLASSLDPGLRYVNHSPTGFEWGYGGSGPAQLAFAILLDHFGNPEVARAFHQDFKWYVIARLQSAQWELLEEDVERSIDAIRLGLQPAKEGSAWQSST